MDDVVKIQLRHVDGDRVEIETPWAKRVGLNLYELDNLPWYAYGVSCGDVVEAVSSEGGLPEVQHVVRKSGNRTIRVVLDPPIPETEGSHPLLESLAALGCSYEGMNRRYFAINIPPEVSLPAVCELVTTSGQNWEHADPTFEQLHPSEGAD